MLVYLRKRTKALKQGKNHFYTCCVLSMVFLLTVFFLGGCSAFSPGNKESETIPAEHGEGSGQHAIMPQETAHAEEETEVETEELDAAGKETKGLHVVVVEEGSFLLIRKEPGAKNKLADDIIVRVPAGWYLEVINDHENKKVVDDFIWWEVKDPLSGVTGWVAENYLRADMIPLETVYRNPFSNDEAFAAGVRLGMSEHEVIQAIGEPINKKVAHHREFEESFMTMEYPFGELAFTEAYEGNYYWLYSIEINKERTAGPRNIQVGESYRSVLTKFPNKNVIERHSDKTKDILYGEYMHGTDCGVVFYDNGEISEIMLATEDFVGLRIVIEKGTVSNITLFVQIN